MTSLLDTHRTVRLPLGFAHDMTDDTVFPIRSHRMHSSFAEPRYYDGLCVLHLRMPNRVDTCREIVERLRDVMTKHEILTGDFFGGDSWLEYGLALADNDTRSDRALHIYLRCPWGLRYQMISMLLQDLPVHTMAGPLDQAAQDGAMSNAVLSDITDWDDPLFVFENIPGAGTYIPFPRQEDIESGAPAFGNLR